MGSRLVAARKLQGNDQETQRCETGEEGPELAAQCRTQRAVIESAQLPQDQAGRGERVPQWAVYQAAGRRR